MAQQYPAVRYRQDMSTPRTGPAFRLDQARTRAANLGLVARTVYAADLPPTRADVAAETALTRSTVSRLVDDLIEGGLVAGSSR